ncbi:MAG: PEP-CTERM sorting domain-containing protein [Deltaproteobacteria bacterium]|nr:PEP-CTERM sorting domain-containing protein [Deltaproteobacteria bacterium]
MRLGRAVGFLIAAGILLALPLRAFADVVPPNSDTLTVNGTQYVLQELPGDIDSNPLSQELPPAIADLFPGLLNGISNLLHLNAIVAAPLNGFIAPTMVQFNESGGGVSDQIIGAANVLLMISDSAAPIVPFIPESLFSAIPFSTVVNFSEPATGLTENLSSTFNSHTLGGTNSIIAFSDGDVSTVPEPPSAVLMLFGLVLIAAPYLWRRKTWAAED